MTAAKNMGKWHRGVERGAEALDSAWRQADLRQSNVQLQREVSEVVQLSTCAIFVFVLFCYVFASLLLFLGVFLPVIYRRGVRYSRCPSLWLLPFLI